MIKISFNLTNYTPPNIEVRINKLLDIVKRIYKQLLFNKKRLR